MSLLNVYRNEHLNNCGNFRAVRDISVAPMDSSDQVSQVVLKKNFFHPKVFATNVPLFLTGNNSENDG